MHRRELMIGGVVAAAGAVAARSIFALIHAAPAQAAMASAAFERFLLRFFAEPSSARDGLDTVGLAQPAGDERVRAEDVLIRALPDSRAVIGLGVLRARRAEGRLAERP